MLDPDAYTAQLLTIDRVTIDPRLTRLNVAGELDGSTIEDLLAAVTHVLETPAPELVELHLADLHFVDSAGIRCLLICRTAAEAAGSRLVLAAPSPQVARVLGITGLLDLFGLAQQAGAA
jgi:anti-anti-sigma factor